MDHHVPLDPAAPGRALALLRSRPDLAARAAFPFRFDIARTRHVEEVRLASGAPLVPVAGTDTGGTYFACPDGAVLYADSEGGAAVIAASVDEALELLVGMPGCPPPPDPATPGFAETVAAGAAEAEAEIREYVPDLDEQRSTLLADLGLAQRPPAELAARLHRAAAATEPEHLLLNAVELCAYQPLFAHERPPLWEPLLAEGRTRLALVRSDRSAWEAVLADTARRWSVLHAAHFDRQEGDLPFLRLLLVREAEEFSMHEGVRRAAVLVAGHGRDEDVALLERIRDTDSDIARMLLEDVPADGDGLRRWAAGHDGFFGATPDEEHWTTWTELARRTGRTELLRAELIHRLDATAPWDAAGLGVLATQFELMEDFAQAARAHRMRTVLQETAWDLASDWRDQAALDRQAGNPVAAWDALRRCMEVLEPGRPGADAAMAAPAVQDGDIPAARWRGYGLGRMVAEEHFEVAAALAATADGAGATARAAYDTALWLLGEITMFDSDLYRAARAAARSLGDVERAEEFARRHARALRCEDDGYSYHPDDGDDDEEAVAEVEGQPEVPS
ncbi:hypothetical protein ACFV7Q_32755 [Streptomyces sp. NPDC059851]|uniref:hypothetical protein n=1 Tax=Streptomyces sp. NPDC059851 TaxID=3346971 RepID=UPI003660CFD1